MSFRPVTLAALVFAVLALLLAACGSEDENSGSSGAEATATATQEADQGEEQDGETAEEKEEDLLDKAWGLEATSRLSCQARMGNDDLTIEIPKYTINYEREGGGNKP